MFAPILEFGSLVQEICTALNVTAKINATLPAGSSTPSTSTPVATFTDVAPHTGVGTGLFVMLGSTVFVWGLLDAKDEPLRGYSKPKSECH
jgi:hypothetical protein